MIELAMVGRMQRRALLVAAPVVLCFTLFAGPEAGLSSAVGIALALANLWLAARVIGAVAERSPSSLLLAGIAALGLGLLVLTVIALGLRQLHFIELAVALFTLVGAHLVLVLWEAAAAGSTASDEPAPSNSVDTLDARS